MTYRFFKWVAPVPTCFSENILPAHAHIVPFSSKNFCDKVDYLYSEEYSDRVILLGETWNFAYFKDGLPKKGFDSDTAEYVDIAVPCSWENAGIEDKKYLSGYSFDHSGAKISEGKNSGSSVGIYRKTVELYDLTKKYFLNFDRVEGGFEVYVNGAYCGFSDMGYGEFDVTDKIVSGKNEILVAVKKNTASAFAVGGERFSATGIVGEVYFVLRNELYLKDLDFRTELKSGVCNGEITAYLSEVKPDSFCTIALCKDGKEIFSVKNDVSTRIEYAFQGEFEPYLNEKPVLYDLYITLEEVGEVTECVRFKVGFGKPEITDGTICYNGKPLKIYGVNYNAVFNAEGEPMKAEDYEKDFRLLREYGFNTICTTYPLPYSVRRLAYVYGLYVIDAVPVNVAQELRDKKKHNFVAYDTKYSDFIIDKAIKTYMDGKLLCNELSYYFGGADGHEPNFAAAARVLKGYGALTLIAGGEEDDIAVIVNPTVDGFIDEINKVSAARPVYMADYAVSYGLGNSELIEFAELIEHTPCAVGGCVKNFVDDCIDGVAQEDCGMFALNRKPYASAHCHRYLSRPVKIRLAGEGKIEIFNNSYFFDTSLLDIIVKVYKNGIELSRVKLNVTVEPREAREIDVFTGHIDGDMYFNVECYEEGGRQVSVEQVPVHNDLAKITDPEGKTVTAGEKFDVLEIRFDGGSVRFSKVTGTIIGYNIKGKEVLNPIASRNGGACFNTKLNRPFIRNVKDKKYCVADYETVSFETNITLERAIVNVVQNVKFGKKSVYTVRDSYTVRPSGVIEVHSTVTPTKKSPDSLDCFGKQLRFYPSFEHVTYYGKGDGDNYIDLADHAVMGLYDTTASDMSASCGFGQECGNRTCVHYVIVRDGDDDGIMVSATEAPMQIRVSDTSDEEIVAGYREKRLVNKSGVYLDVNSVVSGYGSGKGDKPLAKYTLLSGEQNLDIKVYPVYGKHETYGLPEE